MIKNLEALLAFQPVRFVLIGIVNTIIDFSILNSLVVGADMEKIRANIISTTFAMSFSFWANRRLVFRSKKDNSHSEAVLFLVGTLFGLYFIQSVVIFVFADWWTGPLQKLWTISELVDRELFITNSAKVIATITTMFWNFWFYKYVVFRDGKEVEA